MADDNFELIPHRQLFEMKRDVDSLKKSPFGPKTDEIFSKIEDLSRSLDLMVSAFKEANAAMQNEEVQSFSEFLKPLNSKMDSLIEQNKKIAQGILAVADIAKDTLARTAELEEKLSKIRSVPQNETESNEPRPLNVPIPPPAASVLARNIPIQQTAPQMPIQEPRFAPPPLPNQVGMNPPPPMPSGFQTQNQKSRLLNF